jgi:sugar (pentulose or hexulose) kinase
MGGGTKNRFWLQNKADMLGRELEVAATPDVTPCGAAMIAGIGVGVFADFRDALEHFARPVTRVSPSARLTDFYQRVYTEVYRPFCDELAPFNSRLASLRPPQLNAANSGEPASLTGGKM